MQVTALAQMQILADLPADSRDVILKQLSEQQARLQKAASTLGVSEDVTKMRFNQTDAITWVAQHMSGANTDDLVRAIDSIWRSGSAAAHAQYHYGVLRVDRSEIVREEDGRSVVRLRGNLENDVGPALTGATLILNEAFRLYDARRVAPYS